MARFLSLYLYFCIFLAKFAIAAPDLLEPDGIPAQFPDPGRIVVIGDLHGNFDRFVDILLATRLMNEQGQWTGGKTHLVLLGDLNGKGRDTRLIFELLLRLEAQALEAGARVHALLGNHDLKVLWGDLGSTSKKEMKAFRDFAELEPATAEDFIGAKNEKLRRGFMAALTGKTAFAEWIRSRNMVIRIGRNLFAHGGFRTWISKVTLESYNATARAWIASYQGVGAKPPARYEWVVFSDVSTAWDRKLLDGELKEEKLEVVKEAHGVDRVWLGHKPAPVDKKSGVRRVTEIYSGVYMCDTGISADRFGSSSAAVIQGSSVTILEKIPVSTAREKLRTALLSQKINVGCSLGNVRLFGG